MKRPIFILIFTVCSADEPALASAALRFSGPDWLCAAALCRPHRRPKRGEALLPLVLILPFILWNAFTTFWVWNATAGGAIFAILANAFQMAVIFWLFRCSKKHMRGVLPYIFLAVLWIAWEHWYFVHAQISWPWLTLGNAFARSLHWVQWYEYTGTLGGSLWVWACNLSLFGILVSVLEGGFFRWNSKAQICSLLGLVLVFALPYAASAHIWHYFEEDSEGKVNVLIAQPNFDPYQKFESMTQKEQTEVLLGQYSEALGKDSTWTGLLIAPETFTSDVILNDIPAGATFKRINGFLSGFYPNAEMLFGASTYEIFNQRSSPDILAREYGNGWVINRNSAIETDASGKEEIFHKSKLVVGTELTPYPKIFVPLDNMIGGLMGRCKGQEEISCLHFKDIPFGCAVCYESVYPEYCTGYVRKHAKFMTIITNDAWWGNTPGYKQHLSYASLRAIELRRDIARCGNTGISAIINQRGEVLSQTPWWERTVLSGEVNLSSKQTFFVRFGDIVGRICSFCSILLIFCLIGAIFTRNNRK